MTPNEPTGRSNDPTDDAPQRKRGAAAGGSGELGRDEINVGHEPTHGAFADKHSDKEPREEVAGGESEGTAGGPSANAAGDNPSAKQSSLKAAIAFDPEQLSRGGGLSNTPPPKTTLGGEDYLTVNHYLQYENYNFVRELLTTAQQAAQQQNQSAEIQLGDVRCLVSPGGARLGTGPKASYLPWKLDTDHGLTLLLADRAEPHKTQPSLQIRATSLPLMRLGLSNVLGLMEYLIERLGAVSIRNKISRVDPCLDLAGTPVTAFTEPFDKSWFVTRARKRQRHEQGLAAGRYSDGYRDTGFSVGKSPLALRVYDKLYEVLRNPLKLEVLTTARWLEIPDAATRIEFQIGRSRLKRFGIDTVEDWLAKRADVVDYLMANWFRLTSGPVDRQHADRVANHPQWEAARTLFPDCYGSPVGVDLSPLPTLVIDPNQRLAVAVGVLKTTMVEMGYPIQTNCDFSAVVNDLIEAFIFDRDMAAEVARRAIEKGIAGLGIE